MSQKKNLRLLPASLPQFSMSCQNHLYTSYYIDCLHWYYLPLMSSKTKWKSCTGTQEQLHCWEQHLIEQFLRPLGHPCLAFNTPSWPFAATDIEALMEPRAVVLGHQADISSSATFHLFACSTFCRISLTFFEKKVSKRF